MPKTLPTFESGYFSAVDRLLAVAFVAEDAMSAELRRGPSLNTWALREKWNGELPNDVRIFNQRDVQSPFYFTQKRIHLLSIGTDAVAVTTTCAGRPIHAGVIGSSNEMSVFFGKVNQLFDDSYLARWVPAPRARDALVVSLEKKVVFLPVASSLGDDLVQMDMNEYVQFAELAS